MKDKLKILSFTLLAAAVSAFTGCTGQKDGVEPPMMGWSSWNAYMVDISDSIISHQAELMVEKGLLDAGYSFVNIDDGFFGQRDSLGRMVPHSRRFPKGSAGMRDLTDRIHSLGLKAGIYSDAGENTCGSSYNKDLNGFGAGLYGHDAEDAERYFNEWDFDFIKIDYCGGRDLGLDVAGRYTRIREVIDSVATKPVRMNICRWNYPGTWVDKVGESWRISGDIRPVWSSIKYIVGKNLYLSAYASDGHYNDMDMLAVGYNIKPAPFWEDGLGLSYTEEEAHFSIWCIMSSPLLLGCDLEYMPQETMNIIANRELIAINQDPLGLQAHVAQHEGESYVFVKDILKKWSGTRAVALYNPADSAAHFHVDAGELEFEGGFQVRDLNRHEDLGMCSALDFVLPPHSARVFKVEGKRVEPRLYEAEWGYCPAFTAISGDGGKYVPVQNASGRAAVVHLGGSAENHLEWRDVFSRKGGRYILKLRVANSADLEGLRFEVNGCELMPVNRIIRKGWVELEFEGRLRRGENLVCVRNDEAELPAIDRLCLEPTEGGSARWSESQAKEWYDGCEWPVGCDFIPSDAINQIEMWSASSYNHELIDKELGWAEGLGFNTLRVYLSSVVYANDPQGLKERMDDFLGICDSHGIRPLFVFFDDCWNAKSAYGVQPEPKPGIHNSGWVRDPSDALRADTLSLYPALESYMKDILGSFAEDGRILMWDLYNEPGNSKYKAGSLPLLKKAFEWAREVRPSQPLTSGVWSDGLKELNEFQLANSDIVSYHCYSDSEIQQNTIDTLRRYGRPLFCTEYMARTKNCTFQNSLPVLKANKVAAINWGLVAGKTNTIFAWDEPLPDQEEPPVWFHDIFRRDGSPYSQEEVELIRSLTK